MKLKEPQLSLKKQNQKQVYVRWLHTLGFWRSRTGKVWIVCIVQMSDCTRKSSVSLSPWTSLRSAAPGNTVDYGLFWITSVGLLPRQQQLEKTRLPSRVGFCSNQGHEKKQKMGVYNDTFFIYAGIMSTCWCVEPLQMLAAPGLLSGFGPADFTACVSEKRENTETISATDKRNTWARLLHHSASSTRSHLFSVLPVIRWLSQRVVAPAPTNTL